MRKEYVFFNFQVLKTHRDFLRREAATQKLNECLHFGPAKLLLNLLELAFTIYIRVI